MQFLILLFVFALQTSNASTIQMDSMHVELPKLSLVDANGKTRQLNDFPKPFLLHFWASWCTGCRKEIPELEKLAAKGKIKILIVSVDSDPKKAEIALKKIAPTLSFWQANDDKNTKKLWAWGLPVTYYINPNSYISARAMGPRDWENFQAEGL